MQDSDNASLMSAPAPMARDSAPPLTAREASKERHATRLMEATKAAIHQHGIRGATIDRIQALSGLSRGLINARFRSKDNLLEQTVRSMTAEYEALWRAALAGAGSNPARQLRALIETDFCQDALNAPNMTLWFAFRAEARSSPAYLDLIGTRERAFTAALRRICDELARRDGLPPDDGIDAARLLTVTLEGLWVDFHMHPDDFDRQEAAALCWRMMARIFPSLSLSTQDE